MLIEEDFTGLGKHGLAHALDRSPGNLHYYSAVNPPRSKISARSSLRPNLQEFENLRQRAAGPTSNPLRSVLAFVYNLVPVIRSTTKQTLMHADAHLAV